MTQELVKEHRRKAWPSVAAASDHGASAYADSLVERVLVHGLESGLERSKNARGIESAQDRTDLLVE